MNYAEIKNYDIANGPGVRVTLFVSGCPHHCKGCFNPETWDENFGKPFTKETEDQILEMMDNKPIKGLTLLGGEPMTPANQEGLLPLLRRCKEMYPNKDIWCFTGYRYEEDILEMAKTSDITKEFLTYIDMLVDGPFVEAKKNLMLRFRGSSNQRIIMIPESLAQGETVLWDQADRR